VEDILVDDIPSPPKAFHKLDGSFRQVLTDAFNDEGKSLYAAAAIIKFHMFDNRQTGLPIIFRLISS